MLLKNLAEPDESRRVQPGLGYRESPPRRLSCTSRLLGVVSESTRSTHLCVGGTNIKIILINNKDEGFLTFFVVFNGKEYATTCKF